MKNKYIDLIEQTFFFPQEEFSLDDGNLVFHGINLMDLIKQYGSPFKFTYLPKITQNIKKAKTWFNVAMAKVDYESDYYYCYCTKSNHFSFVMEEAFKNDIHIETSSEFDLHIIENLFEQGLITKDHYIICNGFKTQGYLEMIAKLINDGFRRLIPVVDNFFELEGLLQGIKGHFDIGIRIASEEEPKFEFYTSRLGIGYGMIVDYYKRAIAKNPRVSLKMLHFFVNTGIKDNAYYWNELTKCLNVYTSLKRECSTLDSLNIGGGFPIKTSLSFEYEYEYITEEIVAHIKTTCNQAGFVEPHIFTEFGSYTVGEAGGAIFSILGQKKQNDREIWNMIDSSFMTTLPDSWAISRKFIMLPVNHWKETYERVFLGGLTCDSDDYYNSEQHANAIYLPALASLKEGEKLFIGFFNTGAYQDAIGGFGGIQHCLIPNPKHVIIDLGEDGRVQTRLYSREQSAKAMLKILGY